MVTIEFPNGKIRARIEFEHGSSQTVDLSPFTVLGLDAKRLLEHVRNFLIGLRPFSQRGALRNFLTVGDYLEQRRCSQLPTTEAAWEALILAIYDFHFSRIDTKKSLESRQKAWSSIASIFEHLRDHEALIPLGVEVPRISQSDLEPPSTSPQLVGEPNYEVAFATSKNTLVDIHLELTDDDYLDWIRDQLILRRDAVHSCLEAWWRQIVEHRKYGERLLKDVRWEKLSAELESRNYQYSAGPGSGTGHGKYHLANGRTEETMRNMLAVLEHEYGGQCTKPVFQGSHRLPTPRILHVPDTCPDVVSPLIKNIDRISWMLGNLSNMDIAVCTSLLIMHNPCFTPHSLLFSKAYRKPGQLLIEIGDTNLEFTVDKYRATAKKKSKLDELSLDIFEFILQNTAEYRKQLLDEGSPLANLLFLNRNKSRGVVPSLQSSVGYLSGAVNVKAKYSGRSILDYFPDLKHLGIEKGTITFSKLRATEGVIEWFRTGSVSAMANKLGNKESTTIHSYLPSVLLEMWNTRMIRRFQNLLIAAAAPDMRTLLAATDFSTLSELNQFITNILVQHPPESSPLAEALHRNLGEIFSQGQKAKSNLQVANGSLAVSVSRETLSALYLYQDCAYSAGISHTSLCNTRSDSTATPQAILDLAQLLRHRLPSCRDPKLRTAHHEAEEEAKKLSTKVSWHNLFLREAKYAPN